jgi:hypothetical protein
MARKTRTAAGESLRTLPGIGLLLVSLVVPLSPAQAALGPCRADFDRDGLVDFDDLNYVLGNWGSSDPKRDIDGDGLIGCTELNVVQGNFGLTCGCPGDVDGNGKANNADEQLILGALGRDCRTDLDQSGTTHTARDTDIITQCVFGTSGPLGDLNDDGTVDFDDVNRYLGAPVLDCRADINGDGWVSSADLALFFSSMRCCRAL